MEADEFIKQLQGKFLPIKYRDSKDKPFEDSYIQLSVRPIELYEVGYPKECHDLVCNTILGPNSSYNIYGNDGKKPKFHNWIKKYIAIVRKILHLKPVNWKDGAMMPIRRIGVSTFAIGTKDDYTMETGVEGL